MKWAIFATLPSGTKMAFSVYQEKEKSEPTFALVPIDEHGVIRGALYWDSREEAEKHLKAQLEAAPNLEKLGPFEIRPMLEPS